MFVLCLCFLVFLWFGFCFFWFAFIAFLLFFVFVLFVLFWFCLHVCFLVLFVWVNLVGAHVPTTSWGFQAGSLLYLILGLISFFILIAFLLYIVSFPFSEAENFPSCKRTFPQPLPRTSCYFEKFQPETLLQSSFCKLLMSIYLPFQFILTLFSI